jgi:UDP-glucose 4-epimerase
VLQAAHASSVEVIDRRAAGPFNVAAEPPVGRDDIAAALGARPVHIRSEHSWISAGGARLQHIDRGWLDMAFTVPLLDCSRASRELGWVPQWSSTDALADLLDGVEHRIYTDSPPLRRRSMHDLLRRDVTEGLISSRRLP